ncbi:MAG: hypothetical protein GXO23_05345 [Crenarchaeota archaeon]|nr:hypothetical protein [Thermoproteota archaeon]
MLIKEKTIKIMAPYCTREDTTPYFERSYLLKHVNAPRRKQTTLTIYRTSSAANIKNIIRRDCTKPIPALTSPIRE